MKLLIIVLILLSITFILIHNGIVRYLLLHIQNTENFIKNYNKIPKLPNTKKVVISFTSKPSNFEKLKPFINSILQQSVSVNMIYLVLPKNYENHDDLPEYLKKIVYVIKVGRDYKNHTQIVPMLLKETECDTTIISLNERFLYGNDFIKTILNESQQNPNKIIVDNKSNSILFKPKNFNCDFIENTEQINEIVNNPNNKVKINYKKNFYGLR